MLEETDGFIYLVVFHKLFEIKPSTLLYRQSAYGMLNAIIHAITITDAIGGQRHVGIRHDVQRCLLSLLVLFGDSLLRKP